MPTLRELIVFHETIYPLELLAQNRSLSKLEVLRLQPQPMESWDHPFLTIMSVQALTRSPYLKCLKILSLRRCSAGDDGVRLLIEAGMFQQLAELDLSHGNVTDEGVRLIVEHLPQSRLQRLDLTNNALTRVGINMLWQTGLETQVGDQHHPDDDQYLR